MNRRALLTVCLLACAAAASAQSRARFTGSRPGTAQNNYSSTRASYSRYTPSSQPPTPARAQASPSHYTGTTRSAGYQPARYSPPSYSSGHSFRPLQKPVFAPRQIRAAEPSSSPVPQSANEEEQPVPRAGALIRTEGMATQYGSRAPSLLHQVESGGGFITMEAGRSQNLSGIGVQMGRADRNPQSGQASGRNSITTIE